VSPAGSASRSALIICALAGAIGCAGGGTATSSGAPGPSGAAAEPAPASVEPGAIGSGRQSPAAPPAEPSAEIGFQLLRKGDYRGAEPHLAGALRQAPRDRRILEALGAIYVRTKRYQMAEQSLRAALGIDPGSVGAHLGLATVFLDTGRYDEAARELEEVRRRDPANRQALLKDALLAVRRGRAAEGAATARAIAAQMPGSAEPHYVLGLALEQQGDLPGAAGEMRRARDLAPDHLGALSHLAALSSRLGRSADAERFRREHSEALLRRRVEERVRGHRLKGVEAYNRGDYAAALAEFQAIAREDPNDPQVHLHLGSAYIGLGRLGEAKQALETCLSVEPRNERALAEMGRLLALQNRLDEAVAALQKAVEANPQFAEPHYYLAGIYMARGEMERSEAERRRFEELRRASAGAASDVVPAGEGTGP
jgi:Flp pilus assembly protein TadD